MIAKWKCEKCGKENPANIYSPGVITVKCSGCYEDYIMEIKTTVTKLSFGRTQNKDNWGVVPCLRELFGAQGKPL